MKKKNKNKNKITINVTARDIRRGEPDNPSYCPVAIAIHRKTGEHNIEVSCLSIFNTIYHNDYKDSGKVFKDSEKIFIDSPKKVQKFVSKFDDGKKVKPFKFQLDIGKLTRE